MKLEKVACAAVPPSKALFNRTAAIPFGVRTEHVHAAMTEWTDFLTFINSQLYRRKLPRLETMLMPAGFSSMVGEFMGSTIPKHCDTIVKNRYHNGHPDLLPFGAHEKNALQHHHEGIEIKASRYSRGWQGHNPEDTWLMVFVFDSNRPEDTAQGVAARPFRFLSVVGARLNESDWSYSGRSEKSRRTITASVKQSGYEKMTANWIYRDPATAKIARSE